MRLAINAMISSKTIICWESYDTKNALIYEGIFRIEYGKVARV